LDVGNRRKDVHFVFSEVKKQPFFRRGILELLAPPFQHWLQSTDPRMGMSSQFGPIVRI
jgi:hypothetical protein